MYLSMFVSGRGMGDAIDPNNLDTSNYYVTGVDNSGASVPAPSLAPTTSPSIFDSIAGSLSTLATNALNTWGQVEVQKIANPTPAGAAPGSPLYQYAQSPNYSGYYNGSPIPPGVSVPQSSSKTALIFAGVAGVGLILALALSGKH